jgi:hypothetical protein
VPNRYKAIGLIVIDQCIVGTSAPLAGSGWRLEILFSHYGLAHCVIPSKSQRPVRLEKMANYFCEPAFLSELPCHQASAPTAQLLRVAWYAL